MNASVKLAKSIHSSPEDELLVQECLKGSEEAWTALIEKYKNLIFSIPIKYGLSPDDADEIFQAVCLALLAELSQLREPRALAAWLIRLTAHKCLRWKVEHRRHVETELHQDTPLAEPPKMPDELLREIEREQILREALSALSPTCRSILELLFLRGLPATYEDAAKTLGLATGSIGATRMRCLDKLRQALEERGFR